MNIFKVILKNYKQHLLSTLITIISVALGIALVVTVSNIKDQIKDHFFNVASRSELIIGAKGSPLQLVLNSVYFLSAPTGNIDFSYYDSLKEDPMIKMMIPISMGDHYKSSMIVGTSGDFFGDQNPMVKEPISFSDGKNFESTMQAVIGSRAAKEYSLKVGDKIVAAHGVVESAEEHNHSKQPYTVVGIMNPTNSPIDRTIFADIRSVWKIHEHHEKHHLDNHDENKANHKKLNEHISEKHHDKNFEQEISEDELINNIIEDTKQIRKDQLKSKYAPIDYPHLEGKQITSIILKLASPSYIFKIQREINDNTNYQAANPAYEIQKLLSFIGNVDQIILIISYLVVVVAVISVLVATYNIISNRYREIAIIRALGASRQWVISMVLLETIIICIIGWLVGILFGHLLILLFCQPVLELSGIYISPFSLTFEELILLPLIIILGGISGIVPAIKAYKTDVAKNLIQKQ